MKRLPIGRSYRAVDCGHEVRARLQHRFLRHRAPDQMLAVARHAEQCGFESFYFPEHIALYPGASVGPAVFPASTPIADPLECLAFVAAATETHPARHRRPAAALPSPGGSGQAAGHPRRAVQGPDAPAHRGRGRAARRGHGGRRRLRHPRPPRGRGHRRAAAALWDGDENGVSFDGDFFSFTSLCSFPKPLAGGCPSTSAAPARPRPAAPDSAATATSPAAVSPRPNGPPSST